MLGLSATSLIDMADNYMQNAAGWVGQRVGGVEGDFQRVDDSYDYGRFVYFILCSLIHSLTGLFFPQG